MNRRRASGQSCLAFVALLLASCAAPVRVHHPPAASPAELLDRTTAIDRYFSARDLAPIEGIWVWDNNTYEIAIVRNTTGSAAEYQYLGLVTDTQHSNWRRGETKLLLKETASPGIFTGTYLMGDKSRYGTTFFLTNPNLIELYTPTGPYGSQEKLFLIRAYPKAQASGAVASKGESSTGSGFFVSREVIATNYHIVADAQAITVRFGTTQVKAEILLQDRHNDLALLRVTPGADALAAATLQASITCLVIGDPDAVKSGARVYALGFPLTGVLGSTVSVSEGIVNNTVGLQDDPRMFQISVPIQPGSSGSPLLDSMGRVVGVVTSTLNNRFLFATQDVLPQNVNFAVKASYLRSMLALVPGGGCTDPPGRLVASMGPQDIQKEYSPAVVRVEVTR